VKFRKAGTKLPEMKSDNKRGPATAGKKVRPLQDGGRGFGIVVQERKVADKFGLCGPLFQIGEVEGHLPD
jgi:hypothetical protein